MEYELHLDCQNKHHGKKSDGNYFIRAWYRGIDPCRNEFPECRGNP